MALTPEEEKKLRQEIRKQLEERDRKEKESEISEAEEKRLLLEKRLRRKIKEEEEEKFYSERGYVRYLNRHGETEWLTPYEAERRNNSRRSKKSRSRSSHRYQRKRNLIINFTLLFSALAIFVILYKLDIGSGVKTGTISVNSDIPGATIYLDGELLEKVTPDTLVDIQEGRHFVVIYKQGHSATPPIQRVYVTPGKMIVTDFALDNTALIGSVKLNVNVPNYQLYIDGLPFLEEKRNMIDIPTGYHTFMVIKKGYIGHPAFRRILVGSGDTTHVQFELYPDSDLGYLQISNNKFAGYIYVNDKFTGLQARGDLLPVRSGTHEVQVKLNGFKCIPDSHLINILPGEKEIVIFRLEPEEKSYHINLKTNQPGLSIFVDGEWLPFVTPILNLPISPGKHFLNFVKDSRQLFEEDQNILVAPRSSNNYIYYF
jgi:hypothetical protein